MDFHREDRPDTYEDVYSFSNSPLDGQASLKIVRALWGLGWVLEDDSVRWSYSGDFSAVYAEGSDHTGKALSVFVFDFHSPEELEPISQLAAVTKLLIVASAYEPSQHANHLTLEMLQEPDGIGTALRGYRPSRNWSKGHWNNLLVEVDAVGQATVTVIGIAEIKGDQYADNPFMQGDFHPAKVNNLFAQLQEQETT